MSYSSCLCVMSRFLINITFLLGLLFVSGSLFLCQSRCNWLFSLISLEILSGRTMALYVFFVMNYLLILLCLYYIVTNFNCKLVDLRKKQTLPKLELNTNIKVSNLYIEILPYIYIENDENIGKKHDFM